MFPLTAFITDCHLLSLGLDLSIVIRFQLESRLVRRHERVVEHDEVAFLACLLKEWNNIITSTGSLFTKNKVQNFILLLENEQQKQQNNIRSI